MYANTLREYEHVYGRSASPPWWGPGTQPREPEKRGDNNAGMMALADCASGASGEYRVEVTAHSGSARPPVAAALGQELEVEEKDAGKDEDEEAAEDSVVEPEDSLDAAGEWEGVDADGGDGNDPGGDWGASGLGDGGGGDFCFSACSD